VQEPVPEPVPEQAQVQVQVQVPAQVPDLFEFRIQLLPIPGLPAKSLQIMLTFSFSRVFPSSSLFMGIFLYLRLPALIF